MAKKQRILAPESLTPDQAQQVWSWLDSQVADLEVDEDSLREEYGKDFMPALRGLVEHLRVRSNGG